MYTRLKYNTNYENYNTQFGLSLKNFAFNWFINNVDSKERNLCVKLFILIWTVWEIILMNFDLCSRDVMSGYLSAVTCKQMFIHLHYNKRSSGRSKIHELQ